MLSILSALKEAFFFHYYCIFLAGTYQYDGDNSICYFLESLTVLIDHSLSPLARFGSFVNIQYNEIYTSTRSCLVDSVEKWGTPSCLVDIKSSHLVIYVVASSSSKFLHPSSSARCVLSISLKK